MRHKESTLGKGMRRLFRRHRYKVLLVDEFRTSCRCSKCHEECEKFMTIKDPRPRKDGSLRLVHGLLVVKTLIVLAGGIVIVMVHPIFIFVLIML